MIGREGEHAYMRQAEPEPLQTDVRAIRYMDTVPWTLRILFAVLIFSIPFESVETPLASPGEFTIAKFAGWIFLMAAVLYPKNSFRRTPAIVGLFLLYIVIFFFYGLYQDRTLMPAIIERTMTLLQMLVFLWIAQNLLSDAMTAHIILVSLGASTALIAVLQLLGVTSAPMDMSAARMSALGEDPNSFAAVQGLGFLALLGASYFSSYKWPALKIAALPMLGLILVTIVQTGSRGGIIGLVLGLLVFMVNKQGKHPYLKNLSIVTAAVVVIVLITISDTSLRKRFEQSLYHGNLAQREEIIPAALEMIRERPLAGWGPITNVIELGIRTNKRTRDTHNLFLMILTEVGVIGGMTFFLAMIGCGYLALQARNKLHNVVPLALFIFLVVINNTITWHTRKLHWYVLAYCIAAYSYDRFRQTLLIPFRARSYAHN